MKPAIKYLLLGLFLVSILGSCKNRAQNETNDTGQNESEAILESNKGQAFIEDDESTPTVLSIAISGFTCIT